MNCHPVQGGQGGRHRRRHQRGRVHVLRQAGGARGGRDEKLQVSATSTTDTLSYPISNIIHIWLTLIQVANWGYPRKHGPHGPIFLCHKKLSVPERSEGTEVSKMAIREGTVFWGVWGGFPPIIGRTGQRA